MSIVTALTVMSSFTVTPFDTYEDAIRITNSSNYSLTAVVYTQDQMKANRAVRAIDVGMVWVNNYARNILRTPFGGYEHSGSVSHTGSCPDAIL